MFPQGEFTVVSSQGAEKIPFTFLMHKDSLPLVESLIATHEKHARPDRDLIVEFANGEWDPRIFLQHMEEYATHNWYGFNDDIPEERRFQEPEAIVIPF